MRVALMTMALIVAVPSSVTPLSARVSDVPWSGCEPITISKGRTTAYSDADLRKLECFLAGGSVPAGLEMAKHYQRLTPPEFKKARKILIDLARGTRADGSSLEARGGTGGRQFSGAKINSDDSISEVVYRDPSPEAQRELAKMMLRGQGDDRDIEGADNWLKKAIKGGDVEAKLLREALIAKGHLKD